MTSTATFDLATRLADLSRQVDDALRHMLPPGNTRPAILHEAIRYAVFTGGKRLRPILCLAACEAAGGQPDQAMPAALSIELLHTYTLIHDDLPCMDNDVIRRGKPTVHVAFGEANALLAGDALQALAFRQAALQPLPSGIPPDAIVLELADAAGSTGVIGGQVEDLAHTGAITDASTTEFIHRHKTADLFRAAIRMGALAAGANHTVLESLTQYAVNLGFAFQITDDLLDAAETTGDKTDQPEFNCVSVYGRDGARQRAEKHITQALQALEKLPGPTALLHAVADYILTRTH